MCEKEIESKKYRKCIEKENEKDLKNKNYEKI